MYGHCNWKVITYIHSHSFIAAEYLAEWKSRYGDYATVRRSGGSNPYKYKRFSTLHVVYTSPAVHPASYSVGTRILSRVKRG